MFTSFWDRNRIISQGNLKPSLWKRNNYHLRTLLQLWMFIAQNYENVYSVQMDVQCIERYSNKTYGNRQVRHFDEKQLVRLHLCRFQWPRGLRRRSAAARLLRSWVRIPPGAWMFVCCECCVLSGRGLYDELITRPEESYRLWCVVVCDLETSRMRRPWPALGRSATAINK